MTPLFAALGWGEMIPIILIGLLIFGATKLPKLARSMGRSVGEFKQGLKDQPLPVDAEKPEPAGSEKT